MNRFDSFLRKHRLLCVSYESARWAFHRLIPRATLTPGWYGFDKRPADILPADGQPSAHPAAPAQTRNADWYRIARPLYRHEHVWYNLPNALRENPHVKGFAFIFFMGIGDYLYTTPVWGALKKQFPHLPFYGYVGARFDRNNSPLVGKLLAINPHFEKVFYFDGTRHPLIWQNYDYQDALSRVPEGFLVIPVYYQYGTHISHRVASLFDTFGLPVPSEILVPQLDIPTEVAPLVSAEAARVRESARSKKGIVFLQLDSRGSNYTYPHLRALAEGLIAAGYTVLSVTLGGPVQNPDYIELDIKKLAIYQTWQLLTVLKQEFPLYVIAVNSVFWAASAGLGLPNLGLQHWVDKKVHNLWYPNIQVITEVLYPYLPREKQLLAPRESFTRHTKKIIDYKPDWILRWFKQTFE